ncbi:MAG: hypothetical protein JXO22_15395 [Phycisphaerae bacterium]|nr:hypothetical protein [Phycisphaerae bacterium]
MLLANAIGSALLLGSIVVGLLSLVVAVLIETPLLRVWWGRKGVWRWVLAANVVSLVAGVLPAIIWNSAPRPGEGVDPWEWHQAVWLHVLWFCAGLFGLTVCVETAVYAAANRRAAAGISTRRVLLATVVANTLSYVPMVWYLVESAQGTGDFLFSPDTAWVASAETRVYFVDQRTSRLCSIGHDGSDRRLELDEELGRFEGEAAPTTFYALLRDDQRVLFVAPNRHWYVSYGTDSRRLSTSLPEYYGCAYPGDAFASLRQALGEIGVIAAAHDTPDGPVLDGVYLSSSTRFEWRDWPTAMGDYRIRSGTSPYPGTGWGLILSAPDPGDTLSFCIWAGFLSLACHNPAALPDDNTVVFRCGDSIMVMDVAERRVGRLVRGDSLLLKLPQFSRGDWQTHAAAPTSDTTGG